MLKPIINKIASYLKYVSKCCHCYSNYKNKINPKNIVNTPSPNAIVNDGTPHTEKNTSYH